MEGAGAIVGLAIPVFQCAKALRDRIKLVASEKAELLAALTEYEKDVDLLESLYNGNKELLGQQKLDTDLMELAEIIGDLDKWLNSINPNLGKKRLPGFMELWKSGDLREKMVALNAKITSVRTRWQMRLQVCTLASTNLILGQIDSAQTETNVILRRMDSAQTQMAAQLQRVFTMLQQGAVRQRARGLSMHSQVEPAGFISQTTRVVANTTTSIVTFSILSPDASLSYDRIKLGLAEYRSLLASDSDTIELSTENGKVVICKKQAKEVEQFLDQAEMLLSDVIQSRDISTLVVLHRLRDLADVLDILELYDECRLTGSCALDLAEALGRQSLEFKHEQAETLALIAGLSVYQPCARTLFTQAVSICEEVVANNASHSNNYSFLNVLSRAGYWASGYLRAQWLERAVQLMTKELPSTMVNPKLRSVIYNNYGNGLYKLEQYAAAIEAYHEAISICRILANDNPAKYNPYLAQALTNMGIALDAFGKYDDAIAAYKESLEICMVVSAQEPLRHNKLMAIVILGYAFTLGNLNQVSEAAVVQEQAISLCRNLVQTGNECTNLLCDALHHYGRSCYLLGKHAEAVLAYQESILLRHAHAATDSEEERKLIASLHNIPNSFLALEKPTEANAAAIEALERNHGRVLEGCSSAPNFKACFVCQRAMMTDSLGDGSLPLPFFLATSAVWPAQHPALDASYTPAETSTSATSAYIPPTIAARLLGLGRPGLVSEATVPVHLDPAGPSPSDPPSKQSRFQEPTYSSTLTLKPSEEIVRISARRKRDKILGLFGGIRGQ